MNVSVKGEYALQAVFDLASLSSKAPVRIADIARRQKIPQKFLELILASLKQGGFVESRRGAEGGYLLARSPEQITVGEILRYVDGSPDATSPTRRGNSPFVVTWQRVDDAVNSILDRTSFATLAREWAEKQSQFVPNWEI
jgi:Rrf2 family transcriptional regulator, cysteine metabolism repressor